MIFFVIVEVMVRPEGRRLEGRPLKGTINPQRTIMSSDELLWPILTHDDSLLATAVKWKCLWLPGPDQAMT